MRTCLKGLKSSFSSRKYKDGRRAVVVRNGYGPNWREQKLKALERDEYKCTKCGGKLGISVHHRRKIRMYVVDGVLDYLAANDLDNLTTLCNKCHKRADGHDGARAGNFIYLRE